MQGFWLASYVVLWVLVAVMAVVLLSLLRLVGSLQERVGPAGAAVIDNGPDVGDPLGALLTTPAFEPFAGALRRGKAILLVFVSPSCSSCAELLPGLVPFERRVRGDTAVFVVNLDPSHDGSGMADSLTQAGITYLHAPAVAEALGVDATPFGVWCDHHGVVKSKGVVNHVQHLESLRLARELGYASVQQFAAAELHAKVPHS